MPQGELTRPRRTDGLTGHMRRQGDMGFARFKRTPIYQ